MRAYIIRRLLLIIPTLFILTILVFLLVRFIPGDVIDIIEGRMFYEGGQTADIGLDREAVERMLGLDVPVYVQYGRWMGVLPTPDWMTGEPRFNGLLQGSLGDSLFGGLTVRQRIVASLPVTIELGLIALVLGQLIALPVGIYSAIRQDTPADYAGRTIAVIGMATPNFWLGIMVMIFPAIWWGWAVGWSPGEWTHRARLPDGLGSQSGVRQCRSVEQLIHRPALSLSGPEGAVSMRPSPVGDSTRHAGLADFFVRLVREKPVGTASGIVVLLLILVSIFADELAPYPIDEQHLVDRLQAPSARYLLGTDQLGRDFLSRIIYGARLSLGVGLAATTVNVVIAFLIGGTSGFLGGKFDLVVQRFVDAWMAFPGLLILLTVMSITGRGIPQIILVLGISGGIAGSRVLRSAVIGVKEGSIFRRRRRVAAPGGEHSSGMSCPILPLR